MISHGITTTSTTTDSESESPVFGPEAYLDDIVEEQDEVVVVVKEEGKYKVVSGEDDVQRTNSDSTIIG